jgi:hypothetical protein
MLAWARCHVWCARNGFEMLAPNWRHLRIGPYLRREIDKRAYHRLFTFPDYITGIRREFLLATLPKVYAGSADLDSVCEGNGRKLIVFQNLVSGNEERYFGEIVGLEKQVRGALVRMTKPRYLPCVGSEAHIAIHIRMGDFSERATADALRQGAKNSRIAVKWYADILKELRRRLGVMVPARLYSDGPDHELSPILELDWVRQAPLAPAVTDLLSISAAKLLISSGSGFSFWGAYLGHVPRINFPGQRMYRVLGGQGDLDLEPECESVAELSDAFLQHLHSLFSTPRNK